MKTKLKNIKLNITAVYSANQVKDIKEKKLIKNKGNNFNVAGRMGDVGRPITEIKKSIKFAKILKTLKFFGQALGEPYNYTQAKQMKCHIITSPPSIIEKIEKFGKSFDKLTADTVNGFLEDSRKSKFSI